MIFRHAHPEAFRLSLVSHKVVTPLPLARPSQTEDGHVIGLGHYGSVRTELSRSNDEIVFSGQLKRNHRVHNEINNQLGHPEMGDLHS
jgi:hypothetical protein